MSIRYAERNRVVPTCLQTRVSKRFLVAIDAYHLKLWKCLRSRYHPFAGPASDIEHAVDPGEIQFLWEYLPVLRRGRSNCSRRGNLTPCSRSGKAEALGCESYTIVV